MKQSWRELRSGIDDITRFDTMVLYYPGSEPMMFLLLPTNYYQPTTKSTVYSVLEVTSQGVRLCYGVARRVRDR